jgi:pantetheine-phosphate adenylyltransferase
MNKKLSPEVDTVFMMTGERYSYISSQIAREIARFGGKIDDLVPPLVRERMLRKLGRKK